MPNWEEHEERVTLHVVLLLSDALRRQPPKVLGRQDASSSHKKASRVGLNPRTAKLAREEFPAFPSILYLSSYGSQYRHRDPGLCGFPEGSL